MPPPPRILFCTQIDRGDSLRLIEALSPQIDWFFLNEQDKLPPRRPAVGQLLRLQNHPSAQAMLRRHHIQAVVFTHTDDLALRALRAAAHQLGIPSFHLEHGLRDEALNSSVERERQSRASRSARKTTGLRPKLRAFWQKLVYHRFAQATALQLPPAHRRALREATRLARAGRVPGAHLSAPKAIRTVWPDHYLAFSESTLAFHRRYHGLPAGHPATLLGVPAFDAFQQAPPVSSAPAFERAPVLFVDQNFVRLNIGGWTPENRQAYFRLLIELARGTGHPLRYKGHPNEDPGLFERALAEVPGADAAAVEMDELCQLSHGPLILLGYFSTMLLPLAVQPQAVSICLTGHPGGDPSFAETSQWLPEKGVAATCPDLSTLRTWLSEPARLHQLWAAQAPHKDAVYVQWLHNLDGNATGRLAEALQHILTNY